MHDIRSSHKLQKERKKKQLNLDNESKRYNIQHSIFDIGILQIAQTIATNELPNHSIHRNLFDSLNITEYL